MAWRSLILSWAVLLAIPQTGWAQTGSDAPAETDAAAPIRSNHFVPFFDIATFDFLLNRYAYRFIDRVAYGDRFRGTYPSSDPAFFTRTQFGMMGTTSVEKNLAQSLTRNEAVADFAVDYGMPGNPGYAYHRPFDYFNFQFTSTTGSRFENIFTRGLLAGRAYGEGSAKSRGVWGLYGSYDYVAPQIFRVSSVALSLGTTMQRKVSESSA